MFTMIRSTTQNALVEHQPWMSCIHLRRRLEKKQEEKRALRNPVTKHWCMFGSGKVSPVLAAQGQRCARVLLQWGARGRRKTCIVIMGGFAWGAHDITALKFVRGVHEMESVGYWAVTVLVAKSGFA